MSNPEVFSIMYKSKINKRTEAFKHTRELNYQHWHRKKFEKSWLLRLLCTENNYFNMKVLIQPLRDAWMLTRSAYIIRRNNDAIQ